MQSFKDAALTELATFALPQQDDERKAFLSALFKAAGSIELSRRRINLCAKLENYDVAAKVAKLVKALYPVEVELCLSTVRMPRGEKRVCELKLPAGISEQALTELGLMSGDNDGFSAFLDELPTALLGAESCKIAYFKGLFMAVGAVYLSKGGYHFELALDDCDYADEVLELVRGLGIDAKIAPRQGKKIVYIKDKDTLMTALAKLGLTESALKLQEIIDDRETANSLNRAVICETANMDKTFAASSRQMLAIARLIDSGAYSDMSPELRQTADARSAYPEASLNELADILGVTKSCVSHRLRRIVELADLNLLLTD